MVFFEKLSQLGNNCLFGQALFIFIYIDLCKRVPIRKLLPFWVVGPLMCVVVCNHPDWATLSLFGKETKLMFPYPLCWLQFSFLPSDVNINLGFLLLRLCSFDEAVLLCPY